MDEKIDFSLAERIENYDKEGFLNDWDREHVYDPFSQAAWTKQENRIKVEKGQSTENIEFIVVARGEKIQEKSNFKSEAPVSEEELIEKIKEYVGLL